MYRSKRNNWFNRAKREWSKNSDRYVIQFMLIFVATAWMYAVVIMGDFNARIESGPHFQFSNYPHQANNNGKLVVEFATANDLHCFNPMKWKGITEEKFTYQRDMGHQLHQSIIDYALASSTATHKTSRFSVQVGKCHISLFLSL